MNLKYTTEMFLGDGINTGLSSLGDELSVPRALSLAQEAAEIAQIVHNDWLKREGKPLYGIEVERHTIWYETGLNDNRVTHIGILINSGRKYPCVKHEPQKFVGSSDETLCEHCGKKIKANTTWELAE